MHRLFPSELGLFHSVVTTKDTVVFITYKHRFIIADHRRAYGSISYVACEYVINQDANSI
jgi:cell division protein FtsL